MLVRRSDVKKYFKREHYDVDSEKVSLFSLLNLRKVKKVLTKVEIFEDF
jgi:hypothetical protein